MMEKAIKLEWPEWPALIIQQWLEIDNLTTKVKYKYWKTGNVVMVYISTSKLKYGDDVLTWPVYPIAKIQKHLQLDLDTAVTYECLQDKLVVVWVKNQKIDRDEFIKAVEQSFEDLISE
jgi:hypothetical protein